MSVESTFRAWLAADTALVALVGANIAQSAIGEDKASAWVVYAADHQYERALDGHVLADQCLLTVQCLAPDPATAKAVADRVEAVVEAQRVAGADACTLNRLDDYDDTVGLDRETLTVEVWA